MRYSSFWPEGEAVFALSRSKRAGCRVNPITGKSGGNIGSSPDNYAPCLCSFSDIVCFEDCLYCTPMYGWHADKITDAGKMQEYPLSEQGSKGF